MAEQTTLLTIITVNYNNAAGLDSTMQSIVPQLSRQADYVVIDGGSTDGSADILARYKSSLRYCCSESDGGIYNAMNKGVSHSNGKYLLFINSGDRLLPGVIDRVLPYLESETADIFYGDIYYVFPQEQNKRRLVKFPDTVTLNTLYDGFLPHPGSFIRRKLLIDRPYNESLKIAADWEFFARSIVQDGALTKHLPVVISEFESGGVSTSQAERCKQEKEAVIAEVFTPVMIESARICKIQDLACFDEIMNLCQTRRLHKRIRPILRLALAINNLFHKSR